MSEVSHGTKLDICQGKHKVPSIHSDPTRRLNFQMTSHEHVLHSISKMLYVSEHKEPHF